MLERTAVSLESRQLQRVVCKSAATTRRCAKSRNRKLHTGFWHNGTHALELSSLWPVAPIAFRGEFTASHACQTSIAAASVFLLDFLYPNATHSLLRGTSPNLPRPNNLTCIATRKRHFSSSVREADGTAATTTSQAAISLEQQQQQHNRKKNETAKIEPKKEDNNNAPHLHTNNSTLPPRVASSRDTRIKQLQELLSCCPGGGTSFRDVWDLYSRLEESDQIAFRQTVVIYLSKSDGVVETGRALSLFRQQNHDTWNNNFLAAGIRALVRSGDTKSAIEQLKIGIDKQGLVGGVEYILAEAVKTEEWHVAVQVWQLYFSFREQEKSKLAKLSPPRALDTENNIDIEAVEPDDNKAELRLAIRGHLLRDEHVARLRVMEEVPNLVELFFKFESYLTADAAANRRKLVAEFPGSMDALDGFRRNFATAALRQVCPPNAAAKVLAIFNEAGMHKRYLEHMFALANDDADVKASLPGLASIYRSYRKLPNHRIPRSILRSMFQLYYPHDASGLEEVYRDWHAVYGGLDKWTFEKYLKYYALKGDTAAVQGLWKEYIQSFPDVLRSASAFRSTMNVYAQVADVAGARREMAKMVTEYNIEPDLSTWNMLLKCYMRAGDYTDTLSCFDEICKLHKPDCFTFAHVMAMSAKQGDIEKTLELFNKSQTMRIVISKEISMGLIMAYLRNDRIRDAERICTELAARGATSTVIWNQLIYYNGLQGKLSKCYELLQAMKNFGLVWDHQTHEYLLQALVKVDQVQPAFQLLRSAYRDKLFPVRAEHFAIVMAGATRVGEAGLLETLKSDMHRAGFSTTFNSQVSLTEAAYRKTPSAERTRTMAKDLVRYLRAIRQGSDDGDLPTTSIANPAEIKRHTRRIGRAVSLLIDLREFTEAEELVNVYVETCRPLSTETEMPAKVTASLMQAYFREGHHEKVVSLWDHTWASVYGRSKRSNGGEIFPAHRFALSRPVEALAMSFRAKNDGKGLLDCMKKVTNAGFQFNRGTWNLVIRYLAEMNQWEPAMHWCETLLMDEWRGWNPPAPATPQAHRRFKNQRLLIPAKATVLALQRQWLRLRKLAAWSATVSAELQDMERRHPMLHQAFITIDYDHIPDRWAGEQSEGDAAREGIASTKKLTTNRGAKTLLKNLPLADLQLMKKTLEKELEKKSKEAMVKKKAKLVFKRPTIM